MSRPIGKKNEFIKPEKGLFCWRREGPLEVGVLEFRAKIDFLTDGGLSAGGGTWMKFKAIESETYTKMSYMKASFQLSRAWAGGIVLLCNKPRCLFTGHSSL